MPVDKTPVFLYGMNSQAALAVGEPTTNDQGVVVQKFKKDVLSVGEYTHPVWGWKLDITEARLHRFVAAFNQMKANGVDVEVPTDHSFSAEDNLGFVIDMSVENVDGKPTLFNILEIKTQAAIDTVLKNKNVSVAIEPELKDGLGRSYGEAIIHTSVVQQPVVPGQDNFVPIAASKSGADKAYVLFQNEKASKELRAMDKEMLNKFKELLGSGDDITEENILSRITQKIEEMSTKISGLETEKIDLEGKLEAGTKKPKAASMDPNVCELIAGTLTDKVDMLVAGGNISKVVGDDLKLSLIGKEDARCMSMIGIQDGKKLSIAQEVIGILSKNKAVDMKVLSGAQILGRELPNDDDEEPAKFDKEQSNRMLIACGVADPDKVPVPVE